MVRSSRAGAVAEPDARTCVWTEARLLIKAFKLDRDVAALIDL
jgi:hypothetical protein